MFIGNIRAVEVLDLFFRPWRQHLVAYNKANDVRISDWKWMNGLVIFGLKFIGIIDAHSSTSMLSIGNRWNIVWFFSCTKIIKRTIIWLIGGGYIGYIFTSISYGLLNCQLLNSNWHKCDFNQVYFSLKSKRIINQIDFHTKKNIRLFMLMLFFYFSAILLSVTKWTFHAMKKKMKQKRESSINCWWKKERNQHKM